MAILTGEVPAELGDLSSLTELSLRNNRLSGAIPPRWVTSSTDFARFANNAFTGCVPHGLRYLVTAPDFATDVPAHDFAWDENGDGDTADPGDIAGLALPFCGLERADTRRRVDPRAGLRQRQSRPTPPPPLTL